MTETWWIEDQTKRSIQSNLHLQHLHLAASTPSDRPRLKAFANEEVIVARN